MDFYLLFNFNNYFNRRLKRYSTLADYKSAAASWTSVAGVSNFTLADGVDTQWVMNLTPQTIDINKEAPDYLLVCDTNGAILQRWFVIDTNYLRNGQYSIDLHRDTIAESWNSLKSAPMFVEKATLLNTDTGIYNAEDMDFNQIKCFQSELKDSTGCPWIVGYMRTDAISKSQNTIIPYTSYTSYDNMESFADEFEFYDYTTLGSENFYYSIINGYTFARARDYNSSTYYAIRVDNSGIGSFVTNSSSGTSLYLNDVSKGSQLASNFASLRSTYKESVETYIGIQGQQNRNKFDGLIGTYVRIGNTYYQLGTSQQSVVFSQDVDTDELPYDALKNALLTANTDLGCLRLPYVDGPENFHVTATVMAYKITLTAVTPSNLLTYKLSNTRNILQDQPYSMFAMPYSSTRFKGFYAGSSAISTVDCGTVSKIIARDIASTFGGDSNPELYDIQLLPYFPFQSYIVSGDDSYIDLTQLTVGQQYDYVIGGLLSQRQGIIFWGTASSGSFTISDGIDINATFNTVPKIASQTLMVRLNSPNWQGSFDFNPLKNGGRAENSHIYCDVNVDFTYKPYSPYIKVSPEFGGLYDSQPPAADEKDARGLICGGKFDLPQTTDAWASYERSNANYQNTFNRTIQNLEVKNRIASNTDTMNIITGALNGGARGSLKGGIPGAIGGAIAGSVTQGFQYGFNSQLRQETLDYTKDQYGYQLGNIKALSESISTVGSMTQSNTIFPNYEIYDCSAVETNALINKVRYNGMSVGRIGTIDDFKSNTWTYQLTMNNTQYNFFKGRLINLDVTEDYHFINSIKEELDRGIYIPVGGV